MLKLSIRIAYYNIPSCAGETLFVRDISYWDSVNLFEERKKWKFIEKIITLYLENRAFVWNEAQILSQKIFFLILKKNKEKENVLQTIVVKKRCFSQTPYTIWIMWFHAAESDTSIMVQLIIYNIIIVKLLIVLQCHGRCHVNVTRHEQESPQNHHATDVYFLFFFIWLDFVNFFSLLLLPST